MTERQNEIINASIKLIAEKGIQGLTIKNLAKAIKVSEPALYRHFESKTAILVAILDSFKSLMPNISDVMMMDGKTSLEKIAFIFGKYFNRFTNTPQLVSVIFSDEIFKNDKMLSARIAKLMQSNEEMFYSIIKAGQSTGEIRNDISAKHLAIIIMGSFRILVKKWEISEYIFDLEKEGRNLFNSIKIMLKP